MTMTRFADACENPFANGTEGDAWMSKWCHHCAYDHGMHPRRDEHGEWETPGVQPMCGLVMTSMSGGWPEGWIPEPDDGRFYLPSRLVCTAFVPCEPCGGDPGAEERAQRVAEVTAYWQAT